MGEIDTQLSKLTEALDNQVEADKKFEANTQAIIDSLSSSSSAPPSRPPLHHFEPVTFDPAPPREDDRKLEKKAALPDPPSAPRRPPPAASPLLPQVFEDRYAKGWSDACDFIRPQQYEFQRRYLLARRKIASLDRWMKWLPVICFCCTLLGFVLGWCVVSLAANRTLNTPPKVEIVPKM
jgi:hypothetical protein